MRKVGGWNPKIRTNDLCIGPRCKGLYFFCFFCHFLLFCFGCFKCFFHFLNQFKC